MYSIQSIMEEIYGIWIDFLADIDDIAEPIKVSGSKFIYTEEPIAKAA